MLRFDLSEKKNYPKCNWTIRYEIEQTYGLETVDKVGILHAKSELLGFRIHILSIK